MQEDRPTYYGKPIERLFKELNKEEKIEFAILYGLRWKDFREFCEEETKRRCLLIKPWYIDVTRVLDKGEKDEIELVLLKLILGEQDSP